MWRIFLSEILRRNGRGQATVLEALAEAGQTEARVGPAASVHAEEIAEELSVVPAFSLALSAVQLLMEPEPAAAAAAAAAAAPPPSSTASASVEGGAQPSAQPSRRQDESISASAAAAAGGGEGLGLRRARAWPGVAVVDAESGVLVGEVTIESCARLSGGASAISALSVPAGDFAAQALRRAGRAAPPTCRADTPLVEVLHTLVEHRATLAWLVDAQGRPRGMVTATALIHAICKAEAP
jgi:CBS domain-containing protein